MNFRPPLATTSKNPSRLCNCSDCTAGQSLNQRIAAGLREYLNILNEHLGNFDEASKLTWQTLKNLPEVPGPDDETNSPHCCKVNNLKLIDY